MPLDIDLKTQFTPANVGAVIKLLPPIVTPVMDHLYPTGVRSQHHSPLIGIKEIKSITQTVPVVGRDAEGTPINTDEVNTEYIEPLGFRPVDALTAREVNDLKAGGFGGVAEWRKNKIDALRTIIRRSTEGLCAQSVSGAISFPMKLRGGGWGVYTVTFGAIQTHVSAVLWDAAGVKIKDIFKCLTDAHKGIKAQGHGAKVDVWASEEAYYLLLDMVTSLNTQPTKIRVEVRDDNKIQVGGYFVELRNETWKNPQTGADELIVPAGKVKMIDKSNFRFKYLALDNFEAGLQALPFFVEAYKMRNPSRWELIAESKPLPIPVPSAICDITAK